MKKIFHFIIVTSIMLLTIFLLTIKVEAKTVMIGDINEDGKLTSADSRLILRISSKLEYTDNYRKQALADFNMDDEVTAKDAQLLAKKISNKQTNLVLSVEERIINQKSLWLSAKDFHTYIRKNKFVYNYAEPSTLAEVEKSKKVCCASFVAQAIKNLGGKYKTAMDELNINNFRSSTDLRDKLQEKIQLFEKIGSYNINKNPEEVFDKLQPGDIVFFHNNGTGNLLNLIKYTANHVQIFAEKENNEYVWFNAGSDTFINNDYTYCKRTADYYYETAGFKSITIFRIN